MHASRMDEGAFRALLTERGYREPRLQHFGPTLDRDLHSHEFSALLLVTEGEFTLRYEDRSESFGPGECVDVPAGTVHTERAGVDGATVLAGVRTPSAERFEQR